jgi:Flp pilus assembly CpaF family ATPase
MPIRINLLAESQALDEQRRRDPVKRVLAVGIVAVVLMVAASTWLQLKSSIIKLELKRAESQFAARKNEFQQVMDSKQRFADISHKLGALNQLATNRLLYGTLLNAMQQTTIDDVQLVRFRCDQSYAYIDAVKPKTNSDDRVIPGRPAAVTEKTTVTLEARDSGAILGDLVNKFKKALSENPYFQIALGKTNEVRLVSLSPPNALDGKPFVQFTLECKYPEKTR